MFWKTPLAHRLPAIVLWLMVGAIAVSAQSPQTKEPLGKAATNTLGVSMVKTGLFVISGGGCNSVLRLSANGFILVDGKLPGTYPAILGKSNRVSMSDQPIRVLINTDYHENHTGNNANFIEHGTLVLAQENVKQNLANYNPPGGKIALPNRTYDHDYTLKLGGVEAQVMHFGNARTNGDTVVYFPNLRAVAVGDLYAAAPDPDFSAGGSLVGWGPVLAQLLKLDFDVALPGTGSPVTRADIEAFKTKIDTVVSRGRELVNKGVPKNRLMAQLRTEDLGWHLNFTGEQLDGFYAELSGAK